MLTEEQIKDILAEASGGPVAWWVPTFDRRTGRVYFPGQRPQRQRPQHHRAKNKAARKRAKQARKRNRRR